MTTISRCNSQSQASRLRKKTPPTSKGCPTVLSPQQSSKGSTQKQSLPCLGCPTSPKVCKTLNEAQTRWHNQTNRQSMRPHLSVQLLPTRSCRGTDPSPTASTHVGLSRGVQRQERPLEHQEGLRTTSQGSSTTSSPLIRWSFFF